MAKCVIVSGASGGIGSECALAFAGAGFNVICAYFENRERAEKLVEEIKAGGGEASAFCADLRSPAAAKALVMFSVAVYGHLDCVVCAAGKSYFALAQEAAADEVKELFENNVFSVMNLCGAAIPALLTRGGAIITIGSMWGETGAAMESAYSASKGAVAAYTKALAKELGPSGISANCVSPGFIDTAMNAEISKEARAEVISQTPLGRAGAAGEVAKAVLGLAENPFITGQVLGVNGGMVIT